MASVANAASTSSILQYDPFGRPLQSLQTTNSINYTFGYSYDLAGNLKTTTYPSGRIITQSYDEAGRAISLTGARSAAATTYLSNAAYAPHGAMIDRRFGNARWEHREYNPRLQLTSVLNGNSQGAKENLELTLNWNGYTQGVPAGDPTKNNGNPLQQTVQFGSSGYQQTYGYDSANRINSATEKKKPYGAGDTTWSETRGYDAYNNLYWPTGGNGGPTSARAFNSQNRVSSLTYDSRGNMTSGGLTYNEEDQLATDGLRTYYYDGNHRRVRIVQGSQPVTRDTHYVHDAFGNLAAEYDTANSAHPGLWYWTKDHLGSTRLMTSQSGEVRRYDFRPFGNVVLEGRLDPSYGGTKAPLMFTGQKRDDSTYDYFGARYFAAGYGRFVSPDIPFLDQSAGELLSWNLFSYVRNKPLVSIDPSGNCSVKPGDDKATDDPGAPCVDPVEVKEDQGWLDITTIVQRGAETLDVLTQAVTEWASRPRNPTCMGTAVAAGAGTGAFIGTGAGGLAGGGGGALVGFAGGPGGSVALGLSGAGAGSSWGGPLGTVVGGGAGAGIGWLVCAESNNPATGGGSASEWELALDSTGKVHGILPKLADITNKLTKGQLERMARALRTSLATRRALFIRLGEQGNHGLRIAEEQALLTRVERVLADKR